MAIKLITARRHKNIRCYQLGYSGHLNVNICQENSGLVFDYGENRLKKQG